MQAHSDFSACGRAHFAAADHHVVIATTGLDENGFSAHGQSSYFYITQNDEMYR